MEIEAAYQTPENDLTLGETQAVVLVSRETGIVEETRRDDHRIVHVQNGLEVKNQEVIALLQLVHGPTNRSRLTAPELAMRRAKVATHLAKRRPLAQNASRRTVSTKTKASLPGARRQVVSE